MKNLKFPKSKIEKEPSSFRDPAGFLFRHKGVLYRQVNKLYQKDFNHLMNSGLYQKLVDLKLLIPHRDVNHLPLPPDAIQIIKPEIIIPFISYPYEWCFTQLKMAALTTLNIQKISLRYGMSLKDASSYNIQFYQNHPIFIDKLSFAIYQPEKPWQAYRQFCEQFLAPLALMTYTDIRLGMLQRLYINGIPLDLASRLLPLTSNLNFGVLTHIHVHAYSQKIYRHNTEVVKTEKRVFSKTSLLGLIDNLETTIQKLNWKFSVNHSEWGDYQHQHNYSATAHGHKKAIVKSWLKKVHPKSVWDLGANNGEFSQLATDEKIPTIAFDLDPVAVETNYLHTLKSNNLFMQPLVFDLINPSPAIGWENVERPSLIQRGPTGMIFALALIHHLAIANNIPLDQIAHFFRQLSKNLIIEFIPKSDSQVKKMLATRKDIFPHYNLASFIKTFSQYYSIKDKQTIRDSERVIFLMQS